MEIQLKKKEPINACDYGAPGHAEAVYLVSEEKIPYRTKLASLLQNLLRRLKPYMPF
jgi:hypothetical protein